MAAPAFGPAGTLRDRLFGPETVDLFASADMAGLDAVSAKVGGLVVPFARNHMCVLASERLGLTPSTMLDRLLSPDLRLAASTPGATRGFDPDRHQVR